MTGPPLTCYNLFKNKIKIIQNSIYAQIMLSFKVFIKFPYGLIPNLTERMTHTIDQLGIVQTYNYFINIIFVVAHKIYY